MKKNLSQLKRHRQNIKRRDRNRALRSTMRTHIRSAREAIATGDHGEETRTKVASAARVIDRMITRGLVHKCTGARYKSRLMRHYNKLGPAKPEPAAIVEPSPVAASETEETATE